ncbi:MAG: hypothetical protein IKB16_03185 [Lentisphaeria bacterium]|nr:hypothetical protein [Lentisphaeria bacterium]
MSRDWNFIAAQSADELHYATRQHLEEYSQSRGCKIYNCTKGSFIDAYEFDPGDDL